LAKRLTEKQKKEIIKYFEDGHSIDDLFRRFNCTKLTIIRNLKKSLGQLRYQEIVNKREYLNQNLINQDKKTSKFMNIKSNDEDLSKFKNYNKNVNKSEFAPAESFLEIEPLNYEIENTPRKEFSSVPLSEVDLPKTVYMIVDKKIELEIKYLKDYPEWQFLSKDELEKKTIEIYYDLKIAKSFCQKEQKVIKVPNTNVFKIVAPILSSRGITRIISNENLIAL